MDGDGLGLGSGTGSRLAVAASATTPAPRINNDGRTIDGRKRNTVLASNAATELEG